MFMSPKERPKGAMKFIGNLLEAEDIDSVGAGTVSYTHLRAHETGRNLG